MAAVPAWQWMLPCLDIDAIVHTKPIIGNDFFAVMGLDVRKGGTSSGATPCSKSADEK
jgi:hypothetical protein